MLSMSLKSLNIILMCFDGKKQPFEKYTRESTAVVITKKCRKNRKLISFGQMMKYSSFFRTESLFVRNMNVYKKYC